MYVSYRIVSCHIRVFHGFKLGDLFLHCYKFNLSNFFGTYYKRHKPISTPPKKKNSLQETSGNDGFSSVIVRLEFLSATHQQRRLCQQHDVMPHLAHADINTQNCALRHQKWLLTMVKTCIIFCGMIKHGVTEGLKSPTEGIETSRCSLWSNNTGD